MLVGRLLASCLLGCTLLAAKTPPGQPWGFDIGHPLAVDLRVQPGLSSSCFMNDGKANVKVVVRCTGVQQSLAQFAVDITVMNLLTDRSLQIWDAGIEYTLIPRFVSGNGHPFASTTGNFGLGNHVVGPGATQSWSTSFAWRIPNQITYHWCFLYGLTL